MTKRTRVLIVDDHDVVVEGIRRAFEHEPGIELAGAAGDGRKALSMASALKPDIVIMDISMPNLDGIEATKAIKKLDGSISVIIFTMLRDKEYVISLFHMGVSGYVFKDESLRDLIIAVRAVENGGSFFSSAAREMLRNHMRDMEVGPDSGRQGTGNLAKLSIREGEVFPLLADGLSIREIADRLCISPKTVETHKYNIMEKLGIDSLAGLTKLAIRKSLIHP